MSEICLIKPTDSDVANGAASGWARIDTRGYGSITIYADPPLGVGETVDIYTWGNSGAQTAKNDDGTVAYQLTDTIHQLTFDAGPTYSAAKSNTTSAIGVFARIANVS